MFTVLSVQGKKISMKQHALSTTRILSERKLYYLFPLVLILFKFHVNNHTLYGMIMRVRVIAFNATFNNISVISWWSVLLVEETDSV